MPTLCVIDMQPRFAASQKPQIIRNVRREIRSARYRKDAIIFVEYENCGPTDKRILEALKGYRKKLLVRKNSQGGAHEVLRALKDKGWDTNLRIVGVNTDQCVAATVNSLHKSGKVTQTLIVDACNTDTQPWRSRWYTGRSEINCEVKRENRRRK